MEMFLANPAFRVYALCVAVLGVKMLASAVYTGTRRQKVGGFINPEDATTFGAPGAAADAAEAPEVSHALRIQRNDLENIPLFFAVGLVYILSGASLTGAIVFCGLFTVARVAHTFAYMNHLQPARAICFGIGGVSTLLMIFRIILNIL
ncbi:MAG: MAPEG family protein [Deltaproteobacteria bacterium]|nr:MAPEG family protein [Deltaproteobacteria bacterium]